MERLNPKEALEILRKSQLDTKRHHFEAMETNAARIRAILGICGQCRNISLEEIKTKGIGRKGVKVKCQAGCSPLDLYLKTPLGKIPSCPFYWQTVPNPSLS